MTHDHDRGFSHDLMTMAERAVNRRSVLRWVAGAGLLPLIGCSGTTANTAPESSAGASGGDGGSGSGGTSGTSDTCSTIPGETAGPYPGDGTNGANALALTGIVRSDIRSSVAGASGVAEGIPLTVKLKIVDVTNGCAPIEGHAVYIWHCDRDGNYSMYSAAVANENYLRGVQETDEEGVVTFTTIFPACYSGRWPHIHFEVYPSLAVATSGSNTVATSQLAMPQANCNEVFATSGYEASVRNLSQVSLTNDNVFSDGVSLQTPVVTGSVSAGYTATLTVAV